MDKGRSPSGRFRIELEIENPWIFFKGLVHGKPKNALSLPVDYLHFMDAFFHTNLEIFIYGGSRLFRPEGVKIENSIDRKFYDFFFVNHVLLMTTLPRILP
jgi:hypothetical protein